mmetsp:Transcript_53092/g.137309  ORF Transcript_53092/g.137309 Transcript_53092/m.137309 type:complete len:240 (+) Transcript_53092:285-1004(+)
MPCAATYRTTMCSGACHAHAQTASTTHGHALLQPGVLVHAIARGPRLKLRRRLVQVELVLDRVRLLLAVDEIDDLLLAYGLRQPLILERAQRLGVERREDLQMVGDVEQQLELELEQLLLFELRQLHQVRLPIVARDRQLAHLVAGGRHQIPERGHLAAGAVDGLAQRLHPSGHVVLRLGAQRRRERLRVVGTLGRDAEGVLHLRAIVDEQLSAPVQHDHAPRGRRRIGWRRVVVAKGG